MNLPTESMDRPNALFVYGTLAPGQVNAHVLAPLSGAWTEAQISGTLHDAGRVPHTAVRARDYSTTISKKSPRIPIRLVSSKVCYSSQQIWPTFGRSLMTLRAPNTKQRSRRRIWLQESIAVVWFTPCLQVDLLVADK